MRTIRAGEGNEVSFCPERGGMVTSLRLCGKEVLYLDEETFDAADAKVRGGIPILFPNAGPVDKLAFPGLQQHGFAGDSASWTFEGRERGFVETLASDGESKRAYPYEFRLSVEGDLSDDGSFTLTERVTNKETHRGLPLAMGLHPYFAVPNDEKKNVRFLFEGGASVQERSSLWSNGRYVSVDNPKLKDPSAVLEVLVPSLGTLVLDFSAEYRKIWVWSLPGKDFICIEPVMRDSGGLVSDPEMVAPEGEFAASVRIGLRER